MKIIEETKYDFDDLMMVPKRSNLSSRNQVDIQREFKFKHSSARYTGMPIIVANMSHPGTIEMAKALIPFDMSVALHKHYDEKTLITYFLSANRNEYTFYTIGTSEEDYKKFVEVDSQADGNIRYVCIDIANGYSHKLLETVSKLRNDYPNIVLMAGNVVTPDMVYDLIEAGADIIKIGIGSGANCLTRRLTGCGYPQASTIIECADAAHQIDGLVCSDGGVVNIGDFSKAFGLGADFVMSGSIFAAHQECAGEIIEEGGKKYMLHYGMSSQHAMDKHYGGKASYRASEGKVTKLPYKGPVANTVEEILGGIRSSCTYLGAKRLKDMSKCATFIRVNHQLNNSLSQYNI